MTTLSTRKAAAQRPGEKLNFPQNQIPCTGAKSIGTHLVLSEFKGLARHVGTTLVVALDWTGTRPAPTFTNTPQNPDELKILLNSLNKEI